MPEKCNSSVKKLFVGQNTGEFYETPNLITETQIFGELNQLESFLIQYIKELIQIESSIYIIIRECTNLFLELSNCI